MKLTPARHRPQRRGVNGDPVREALTSLRGHPAKTLVLSLGAALGTASVAAILTLAASGSKRVDEQFDALRSTRISITNPDDAAWVNSGDLARLQHMRGVTAAGVRQVASDMLPMSARPAGLAPTVPASVVVASPAALDAVGVSVRSGRLYDQGAEARSDPVVVLGSGLANSLGNPPADGQTTVTIDGARLLVIGVVDAATRGDPSTTLQAFIPTPRLLPGVTWVSPEVIIDTRVGLTDSVASIAPVVLSPNASAALIVQTPADPQGLHSEVSAQLHTLLVLLGCVSLGIGMVVISTATLSSIAERRTEIALRRALGTTRTAIYVQIVVETALIGALGGFVGVYLGEAATVVFAKIAHWPLITSLWLVPVGFAAGALAGSFAGLYPAARAARAHPADALRS
ncbi:MAG: hypothetical protein DLM58_04675 [Pseudonocardiales bacterium]|nr:MAG: hypothetical protein DLM58_04675 [Pseudonocardiales bacterium]